MTSSEDLGAGDRRRSVRWGYDDHERSVLDVVDEEEWRRQERWAVDEALGYARVTQRPSRPWGARHMWTKSFMDRFEAMLNDLLHEPLNICTATETVQETNQEGLDAYL